MRKKRTVCAFLLHSIEISARCEAERQRRILLSLLGRLVWMENVAGGDCDALFTDAQLNRYLPAIAESLLYSEETLSIAPRMTRLQNAIQTASQSGTWEKSKGQQPGKAFQPTWCLRNLLTGLVSANLLVKERNKFGTHCCARVSYRKSKC